MFPVTICSTYSPTTRIILDDVLRAVPPALSGDALSGASPAWWGSPRQTIVIAWKHFCADRQNWATYVVLIAKQLSPVFALMPTINC